MNAQSSDDCSTSDCISEQPAVGGQAAIQLSVLEGLQHELTAVRREMHDLAEWRSSQPVDPPMPVHVFRAADRSMDRLSEQAALLCDKMAALATTTMAGLKCKASALEYLLPEETDSHIVLCRSLCADIRRF